VASQLRLLKSGELSASAAKRVAINALIACCDDFDVKTAGGVFTSHFNAPDSSHAELEDLVGNLIFHTSFGSLDVAASVANAIAGKCLNSAESNYKQTQLLRWCSQPFHNLGDSVQARSLLGRARELATANGQPSEVRECRALEVMHALDLEDATLAGAGLAKLMDIASANITEYPRASLLLLQLRLAVLQQDVQTAQQCMSELEGSQLPDGARARLTLSCCRLHTAALEITVPASQDVSAMLTAPAGTLSSIDMDWNVLGLCAVATLLPSYEDAASVAANYLQLRRPRFPMPNAISALANRQDTKSVLGALSHNQQTA
jgi:hypothetical protein